MGKRTTQLGWLTLTLMFAIPSLARAQFAGNSAAQATASWAPQWPSAVRQPAAQPHPAVARITVPAKEKGTTSYGSGTLVDARGDYGLVITNWHVVQDAGGNITVNFPDGFRCAARVLKTDKDWDLAALAIWRPKAEPVSIAAAPPQPGDLLTIAGYGSGDYRAVSGRCLGFASPGGNLPPELVDLAATARQGDSGGPILNTQGELAGVLFGTGGGTTVGSFSTRVRSFLTSLAPDLGRPDVSNIANKSPREEPAVAAAPPPIKSFAPAIVHAPPVDNKAPFAKPPAGTQDRSAADRLADNRLTPVAPAPHSDAAPFAASDRVAGASFGTPPGLRPLAEPAATDTKTSSLEARVVDVSRPLPGITWQALAGETLMQQVKTVLAAIGVLALLFHGLRLSGRAAPQKAKMSEVEEDE